MQRHWWEAIMFLTGFALVMGMMWFTDRPQIQPVEFPHSSAEMACDCTDYVCSCPE